MLYTTCIYRNICLFYRICNIQCEIIRGHAKGATFAKRLGTVSKMINGMVLLSI